jgi:hypothetical protein
MKSQRFRVCLLGLGCLLAGSAALAGPPDNSIPLSNRVPAPHQDLLIAPPPYLLDSSIGADVAPFLRPNSGPGVPGLILFVPMPGERLPPVVSRGLWWSRLFTDPYDIPASEVLNISAPESEQSGAVRFPWESSAPIR